MMAAVLAQAPAPALQLEWSAPPQCPSREAVLASIERRLGSSPRGESISARVTLVEQGGVFRLSIETQGGAKRELLGPSCSELAEAGALILALLIDPLLLSRPPAAPEQTPAPEPAPGSFSALLGVSGVADWGALPSLAAGWHASLLLDVRAFHLEAFGGTFASQHLSTA